MTKNCPLLIPSFNVGSHLLTASLATQADLATHYLHETKMLAGNYLKTK